MPDEENLKTDGFVETGRTKGQLRFEMGDRKDQLDYSGTKFVNSQGTIGYVAATADNQTIYFFLSLTARGQIITVPEIGPDFGKELSVQGARIRFVPMGNTLKATFDEHRKGLATESLQPNRGKLDMELNNLPQRIVDLLIAYAKQKGLDKL